MKLFLIFISLIVSSFFMLSLTNKLAAEEVWKIKEFDTFGYASVSGEIQHGDKLAFILLSDDNCETVSSWFTFYTWQDPSDFGQLVDKDIPIMLNGEIKVSATAVRVPVIGGHSESINITLKNSFNINDIINLLENTPGLVVQNDPTNLHYPMPLFSKGKDEVFVGRIREDLSEKNSLNLWVVADNLRKGAATNAVQIAEYIIEKKFIN